MFDIGGRRIHIMAVAGFQSGDFRFRNNAMPKNIAEIGVTHLDGDAVRLLMRLRDDNHSEPAEEESALRNFDSFAESFFKSHRDFIRDAKE